MHTEALEFVTRWAPAVREGADVIEVGACDRNGPVRGLFGHVGSYVGLDIEPGPGVDIVADARSWMPMSSRYDAVVSTETLEHIEDWQQAVHSMALWLRPGGMLLLTCAGRHRKPHAADGSPGGPPAGEWYGNVDHVEMMYVLRAAGFAQSVVALVRGEMDLQVVAWAEAPRCGRISCPRS